MISAGQFTALSKTMARNFEQAFGKTVTIGAHTVACSSSGFALRARMAEDGEGRITEFEVTLRITREAIAAAGILPAAYALHQTLTTEGRLVTVDEVVDRPEVAYVVLRCMAPGDGQ